MSSAADRTVGTVLEVLPDHLYRVQVGARELLCHDTSALRRRGRTFEVGARVAVEVVPGDSLRGRIAGAAATQARRAP